MTPHKLFKEMLSERARAIERSVETLSSNKFIMEPPKTDIDLSQCFELL